MKRYGPLPGIQEHGIGQMALGRLRWMDFIRVLLPPGILSMANRRSFQLPLTLSGSRSSHGIQHNSNSLMLQVWVCFVMSTAVLNVAMMALCRVFTADVMSQLLPVMSNVAQLHNQVGKGAWKISLLFNHSHLDTMCKVNTAGQPCFCSQFPLPTGSWAGPVRPPWPPQAIAVTPQGSAFGHTVGPLTEPHRLPGELEPPACRWMASANSTLADMFPGQ